MLVVLVVLRDPGGDAEVLEQQGSGAGVLGQHKVGLLQDLNSPESHIIKIPDRSRHYVQNTLHRAAVFSKLQLRKSKRQASACETKAIIAIFASGLCAEALVTGTTVQI